MCSSERRGKIIKVTQRAIVPDVTYMYSIQLEQTIYISQRNVNGNEDEVRWMEAGKKTLLNEPGLLPAVHLN